MFSIVIPLYNKENSIQSTLKSILSQTYQKFEIVVVDDGSTDSSAEKVLEIFDERIRLIRKENGGVCSARNRGIKEAKYDYIALLDADDTWDENYLNEQVKMINDYPNAKMWGINYAEMSNGELARYLPTGLSENFRGYVEDYFYIKKKPLNSYLPISGHKKILAIFYFRFTLSSTFRCLTSVFGMGTGEPPSYFHQYIFNINYFSSSLKTR